MLARSRKEAGTTPRKRTGYDAACYYDGKLLGRCTKADSDAYTLLMNACGGEAARVLREYAYFSPELKLSLMNEKQSLSHFKGRSLCWKASRRYFPRRRKHSAKKKLSVVFMRCSENMGTDFPNHSQHCCPGLLMV